MTTEYQINSQKHTVEHFQKQFDKITEELNKPENFENEDMLKTWNVIRNVLVEQEEKLEKMKNESST